MTRNRRLVVKLGSSSITGETGPESSLLTTAIDSAVALRGMGWDTVIVSSGAVSSGRRVWATSSTSADDPAVDGNRLSREISRQLAAAIGQPLLQSIYRGRAVESGQFSCQILVGESDLRSSKQVMALSRMLSEALLLGVIPIVNGNDAVDSDGSDNDAVAAAVATMCEADLLLLLTDTDGVYLHQSDTTYATHIEISDLYKVTSSRAGTGKGGIRSKLRAAELAGLNGISTRIAAAKADDVIVRAIGDRATGTLIPADIADRPSNIKFSLITVSQGAVVINKDAHLSIQTGSSLFSSGIKRVTGEFKRGDVISITDPRGRLLARGVSNVSSILLLLIRALRRDAVAHILLAILERSANKGSKIDPDNRILSARQDGKSYDPYLRALEQVNMLSPDVVGALGGEILGLYPRVAARLITAHAKQDHGSQIEMVSRSVGELEIVENLKLEVMSNSVSVD